jgi:hypothetical protein
MNAVVVSGKFPGDVSNIEPENISNKNQSYTRPIGPGVIVYTVV